jgi:membrane-associated protease RseP (regulator of RpoE activity)
MVLNAKTATAVMMVSLAHIVHAQQRGARGQGGAMPDAVRQQMEQRTFPGKRPVLYGFALECVDCTPALTGRGQGGRGGAATLAAVWNYTSFPRVAAVLPNSAAEQAGIRVGDLLASIDGLSLLTEEGSRRFANATSGEDVRLTFERSSKLIDIPLTLGRGRMGGPQQVMLGTMSARFSGAYGNVDLDVWSDDPVNISRDSTGAMILRTGTTVVRLKTEGMNDSTVVGGAAARGRGRGRGGPPD